VELKVPGQLEVLRGAKKTRHEFDLSSCLDLVLLQCHAADETGRRLIGAVRVRRDDAGAQYSLLGTIPAGYIDALPHEPGEINWHSAERYLDE
jgi:hypothetical protein